MSYSESEIRLYIFSPKLEKLKSFNQSFKSKLNSKGGEYNGPAALPKVDINKLSYFIEDPHADCDPNEVDVPNWLIDAFDDTETRDTFIDCVDGEQKVHARQYRIFGEQMIRSALDFESPECVYFSAELDKVSRKKGYGKHPAGWDPNDDHVP
jgi:hypothetical protein